LGILRIKSFNVHGRRCTLLSIYDRFFGCFQALIWQFVLLQDFLRFEEEGPFEGKHLIRDNKGIFLEHAGTLNNN